jgi:hypothetical protein
MYILQLLWHLTPAPSTLSATKTPQDTEEDSNDTEPADEQSIPVEYSSDQLYSQSKGATIHNYLYELRSV